MVAHLLRGDRSLGEIATVGDLCDRIIARKIGMPPGPVTPAGIRAYALAMHCGVSSKTDLEAIAGRFAAASAGNAKGAKRAKGTKRVTPEAALALLGEQFADRQLGIESKVRATSKAAAKAAMLQILQRRWVSQQDESDEAQQPSAVRSAPVQQPRAAEIAHGSPLPLTAPAADAFEGLLIAVREAMPMIGAGGRYGEENVFISALWQQVALDQRLSELSLDGFKRWLVTANRHQQLALVSADTVDDMDMRLLEASAIHDQDATFHFVVDRRGTSPIGGEVSYGR
jgi:hypothetical protein